MNNPVVRLFATGQQARDAAQRLSAEGFANESIVVASTDDASAARGAGVLANLASRGLRYQASIYGEGLAAGQSLVAIDAPYGCGEIAANVLDACGPVDFGDRLSRPDHCYGGEAAPLSALFGMPTLMRGHPAPLSDFIGLPMLSRRRSVFASACRELARSPIVFKSFLGMSLLSRNATPLSSMIGMKPLTRARRDWQRSFGLPLLSRGGGGRWTHSFGLPLLSRGGGGRWTHSFGLPLLSRGGGSRWTHSFGFPMLSRNAAPLSSMIGMKPLSASGRGRTHSFGLPLLSGGSTTRKTHSFGLPLLSRNAAPLSSALGLETLFRL
jgi:hypothetical protein